VSYTPWPIVFSSLLRLLAPTCVCRRVSCSVQQRLQHLVPAVNLDDMRQLAMEYGAVLPDSVLDHALQCVTRALLQLTPIPREHNDAAISDDDDDDVEDGSDALGFVVDDSLLRFIMKGTTHKVVRRHGLQSHPCARALSLSIGASDVVSMFAFAHPSLLPICACLCVGAVSVSVVSD
jgi:hypothetical protein